ncbi:MAG: hypothetical protein GVY13_06960 [Alphaproteobacteria bacterium]|jgi:ABC-type multidrug transport system fused ATPase/permease subunit|nr:hypothetical protein [Alphaproteobacteria bacterium]
MSPRHVPSNGLPGLLAGRRRRWAFARLLANGLVQAGGAVALPFAIAAQTDGVTPSGLAGLAGLAVLLVGAKALEFIDAERLGADYVQRVRLSLLDGLLAGTASTRHGVAMSRLMNDLSALKDWVGLGLARLIVAPLALGGCLAAAALISPLHLLVLAAPVLLAGLVGGALVAPLRRRVGEVRRRRGRVAARAGETLLARDLLKTFGQGGRGRRRVARAGRALYEAQIHRMRLAGLVRAMPDMLLPMTVLLAVIVGMPFRSDTVSIALLAGLAADPVRKALRAIEYRAAFVVARQRLLPGLGRGRVRNARPATPAGSAIDPPPAGLHMLRGPHAVARSCVPEGAVAVTATPDVLPGSLRRNIDLTRRWRGADDGLGEIAAACGLAGPDFAPQGLDTRLRERDPRLSGSLAARLSLARALAAGVPAVCVDAPVLLAEAEGRDLLRTVPDRWPVALYVLDGESGPAEPRFAPEPSPAAGPS